MMKIIPFINLKDQHLAIRRQLLEAVGKVFDHANFILGRDVQIFEKKLADYCGTKYAVGVNSGFDALFLALKAYGIGPGDEVITAPNSFLASASVIVATGAKPVLVDIGEDFNMNPLLLEKKMTKKTKAIMPVHLYGRPAQMRPILELAKRYRLRVIEDAAQAIGAEYHGKKVGSIGDAGCFSLHPLKTLNACGDGGALTTNDESVYHTMIQLRNIGLKNREESDIWGFNSRLDSIQAAILNVKLDYLDEWTFEREKNAEYYVRHLEGCVKVPRDKKNEKSVYHAFVIQAENRDALKHYLLERGVETKIHYPIPIHLQKSSQYLGYGRGSFPVCERAAETILSLPVYQGLKPEDLEYIVENIKIFFQK